jgi:hypothetical protein
MQVILLIITVILSVILYRMLSSQRATFPYIRTTRLSRAEDDSEYSTTEAEQGLITIDHETVIVEGQEFSLKSRKGMPPEAYLNVDSGKLISICIRYDGEEKFYYIDPDHSLFPGYITDAISNAPSHHHHIFSF